MSDTSFNPDNLNILENNNQIGGFFSNPITPVINTVKIIMKNIANKQNNLSVEQNTEIIGGDSEPDSLFNSEKSQETSIQNSQKKTELNNEVIKEVEEKNKEIKSESIHYGSKSNLPSSLIVRNFTEISKKEIKKSIENPIENSIKKVNQEIPLADSVKTTEIFEDKITLQSLPQISNVNENTQDANQSSQIGGSKYKNKYLKYKQKYLELKKSMRKID